MRAAGVAGAIAFSLLTWPAWAQRASFRVYDVGDGLAQSNVWALHQDRRGYLWVATAEGLSRFDGYRFLNYRRKDGLPATIISAITEDTQGRIWVGTWGGGVAHLAANALETPGPSGGASFVSHRVGAADHTVQDLAFAPDGTLWCATETRLYRGREGKPGEWAFEAVRELRYMTLGVAAGKLWLGAGAQLFSLMGGELREERGPEGVGGESIRGLAAGQRGTLLVAYPQAVFELAPGAGGGTWTALPVDLTGTKARGAMAADVLDNVWIDTELGLRRFERSSQRTHTFSETRATGAHCLAVDREGNLWLGSHGLFKLPPNPVWSFALPVGLTTSPVAKVVESRQGRIYAGLGWGRLAEVVAGRVVPVPGFGGPPFHNVDARFLQDRRGDWWVGTDVGLYRFKGPALQPGRGRRFTARDGLPEGPVFARGLYEDAAGRIWVSVYTSEPSLHWCDPTNGAPLRFNRIPLSGAPLKIVPYVIGGDRSGGLWVASFAEAARLRDGRFLDLKGTPGLPAPEVRAMFQDSRGWLWLGLRFDGVSVTKEPAATPLRFVNYSTRNGLQSDVVWGLGEDAAGRMYFGTARGLDRLDLRTGRFDHFDATDGLASNDAGSSIRDRNGDMWVPTDRGLSKLTPGAVSPPAVAPPIYLTGVRVAGEEVPVPERGAVALPPLTIPAAPGRLAVEYVGLSFLGEGAVRYQYQLEGIDRDWSPPVEQHVAHYGGLGPGSYRLLVRAVTGAGVVSEEPAALAFLVRPPLWRRSWFLTLLASTVAMAALGVHRLRRGRRLAVEHVRQQIARDLHDELGSGLGSIGILAGVLADAELAAAEAGELRRKIASTAGELGVVLTDIVWSLRPGSPLLEELACRLAEHGSRLFPGTDPEFRTSFPGVWPRVPLSLAVRRNLLLIGLEALHNAARHARARCITLGVAANGRGWSLSVSDDGRGLGEESPSSEEGGLGLESMRRRARDIGAQITWSGAPGSGTTVTVVFDPQRGKLVDRA